MNKRERNLLNAWKKTGVISNWRYLFLHILPC